MQKDFLCCVSFLSRSLVSCPLSSGPLASFYLSHSGQMIFVPHLTEIIWTTRQNLPELSTPLLLAPTYQLSVPLLTIFLPILEKGILTFLSRLIPLSSVLFPPLFIFCRILATIGMLVSAVRVKIFAPPQDRYRGYYLLLLSIHPSPFLSPPHP